MVMIEIVQCIITSCFSRMDCKCLVVNVYKMFFSKLIESNSSTLENPEQDSQYMPREKHHQYPAVSRLNLLSKA